MCDSQARIPPEAAYELRLAAHGWERPWGALSPRMQIELRAFLSPFEIEEQMDFGGSPDRVHPWGNNTWPSTDKAISRAKGAITAIREKARKLEKALDFKQLCRGLEWSAGHAQDVYSWRILAHEYKLDRTPRPPEVGDKLELPLSGVIVTIAAELDAHFASDEEHLTNYAQYKACLYVNRFETEPRAFEWPEEWPEDVQPPLVVLHGDNEEEQLQRDVMFLGYALASTENPNRDVYTPERNRGPSTIRGDLARKIGVLLDISHDKAYRRLKKGGFSSPEEKIFRLIEP